MTSVPAFDPTILPDTMRYAAALFFVAAVLHTFTVKKFQRLANKYPEGSIPENLFHFLGEVEVVFGIWAALLMILWASLLGSQSAVSYLESVNYTEAGFVFVIMTMAATRPIMTLARRAALGIARLLPLPRRMALYASILIAGPLLGSLITEPAAMTVTALLLKEFFLDRAMRPTFAYATLGLLFVNISIGGTLTHFAAPPVLMVAGKWGWNTATMLSMFGWRAALAVVIGTLGTVLLFRSDLSVDRLKDHEEKVVVPPPASHRRTPAWIMAGHLLFMIGTIVFSHHLSVILPLFLFFVGWCSVTREFQDDLKFRESMLVAFFLGGLVTLGNLQDWWLAPIVARLSPGALYWGATALTAVTDNAALTYLGTLVPDLSHAARYALVGGAVTGGGLTVIANAPNPAGYGILSPCFGEGGISPLGLFLGALPYTLTAAIFFLI